MGDQMDPLFAQWRTYEKLVKNNHMYHVEFFETLAESMASHFPKPVWILDLGCGDCSPIDRLLDKTNVSFYKGIDESSAALRLAENRLSNRKVNHRLQQFDMLSGLDADSDRYDLILTSYALHHLSSDRKAALLDAAARRLKPAGIMAVVDIFRRNGESRNDYLTAWMQNARQHYDSLDPAELELLFTHVEERDFPESPKSFSAMAREAGFKRFSWSMSEDGALAGIVTLQM